ncbi:hypothetical protein [Sessilibacter corallicola]|uniref:hypothetical protein n=1 Tax=Sessilibacter corallicola TaxID=2904075 RepID=UPI001E622540|nr:hypothetical protein [Sessilibacter corallicola]MCE2029646.1 hypothetical protein [Sessilibacter corallicola]
MSDMNAIKQNIWAMNKTQDIKSCVLLLDTMYDNSQYILDEGHEADLQSIYIRNADCIDLAAYIYTYGQNRSRYGVELLLPINLPENSNWFSMTEKYENQSDVQLMTKISSHLNLNSRLV